MKNGGGRGERIPKSQGIFFRLKRKYSLQRQKTVTRLQLALLPFAVPPEYFGVAQMRGGLNCNRI
jgi:hypothetical protein